MRCLPEWEIRQKPLKWICAIKWIFSKNTAIEENFSYPDFLNEDSDIVYKFDTESLLEYYSELIAISL